MVWPRLLFLKPLLCFWHSLVLVEEPDELSSGSCDSLGPLNPTGETTIAQRMGFIFIPERLIYSTESLITRPDQWKGQRRSVPSADSSSLESVFTSSQAKF